MAAGGAGNSGVIYRVIESDAPSWASGPEYQVLDDVGHPDGRDPGRRRRRGHRPQRRQAARAGRALQLGPTAVRDGHVEHWLNDRLVLAYDWASPDVRAPRRGQQVPDTPAFMTADGGAIVLQHHGEEVWFRKVRIRDLT